MIPDHAALRTLLDSPAPAAWQDGDGNSLLHHAARLGDAQLVEDALSRGLKADAFNQADECPRDVAQIWGHDALAKRLAEQMHKEKAAAPPALGYSSLAEIRAAAEKQKTSVFCRLARRGLFDQVIALAKKDPGGLTAQDLLEKGPGGDSVLLALCRQGQLPLLLQPELWVRNAADFAAVWESTPKAYRQGLDIDGFRDRVRQARLSSKSPRPALKGPS